MPKSTEKNKKIRELLALYKCSHNCELLDCPTVDVNSQIGKWNLLEHIHKRLLDDEL